MSVLRFVILRHEGIDRPHFDLMFETSPGSDLLTFRSREWPPSPGTELILLGDHRRTYLDYEGPLSNNRGRVRRVLSGTCELSAPERGRQIVQIREPQPLEIAIEQTTEESDRWRVIRISA